MIVKISSIDLSPVSNMLAVVVSKSLCNVSKAMIIAIVSNGSLPSVIAALSRYYKSRTSAKISTTGLSNTLSLLAAG